MRVEYLTMLATLLIVMLVLAAAAITALHSN